MYFLNEPLVSLFIISVHMYYIHVDIPLSSVLSRVKVCPFTASYMPLSHSFKSNQGQTIYQGMQSRDSDVQREQAPGLCYCLQER